ncbi:hypothetical protein [Candidatus Rhabdochlamydia sp. T3358]|uniref:hypothetical protein n=1 Tax=Candidatus Rhabdochlamydia sp. T3358 TaxID=2099795 RepID=UPI0010BC5F60|nr:hypothetical protein [Candidatus Rhabdochlamydia sp. T3358]VHO01003.1 hypothetical protein RHT_00273 [Candidatus Rhabdochlamydia sp. T3358]
MGMLSIDASDASYQSFRSKTTLGLEMGSLVAGGYGAVKGMIAFNRLARASVGISKIMCKTGKPGFHKIDNAVKMIEDFLHGRGKVITNADGDMILMGSNNKIRFDIRDPHGDKPHFHLEKQTPNGKWIDAASKHRYYFTKE